MLEMKSVAGSVSSRPSRATTTESMREPVRQIRTTSSPRRTCPPFSWTSAATACHIMPGPRRG
jgi:hypothetical protein